MTEKVQAEVKDLLHSLQRILATNKQRVLFVGALITFNENNEPHENGGVMFAHGNKSDLRLMINDLRNNIEDNSNEDGFVNI